jgi:hypothetical protein
LVVICVRLGEVCHSLVALIALEERGQNTA